jgi:2-polyprenyl-3-methyl-5-hydroxy-6-metoxy-1,4-benzoquinol methylase
VPEPTSPTDGRPVASPGPLREHWEAAWRAGPHEQRGWFQADPQPSLDLVLRHTPRRGHVLDVGGGASLLVDRLLDAGRRVTVVDLAAAALEVASERLGDRGADVDLVQGDVTELDLRHPVDTWHDRAVLHFLVDPADRAAYADRVAAHVRPGGVAVIGTFAPDGPTTCSGLPVHRTSAADISELLGDRFALVEQQRHLHRTPAGGEQAFAFCVLRRSG